jgi:transposase
MEVKEIITEKIKGYYLKGLNYKEIGKLLDISPRTVQRYIKSSECKKLLELKTLQQRAIEMHLQGWSYAYIAKKLKVSKTTIYLWHRKVKQATSPIG